MSPSVKQPTREHMAGTFIVVKLDGEGGRATRHPYDICLDGSPVR